MPNIKEDIGFIKAKVESIESQVKKLNGCIRDNDKRLDVHDKLVAKATGYIVGIGTIAGIVGSVLVAWIKSRF